MADVHCAGLLLRRTKAIRKAIRPAVVVPGAARAIDLGQQHVLRGGKLVSPLGKPTRPGIHHPLVPESCQRLK